MFFRLVLATLFAASALRLAGFVLKFSQESLQQDFSAYYAAGEALRHGLSPYRTHVHHDPPIWDEASVFTHSRFLYPPLVASLFQPLAHVPYSVAKHLWTLSSLACIALAMGVWASSLKRKLDLDCFLALGAWVCLFHPLLTLLERGQMDAVTLLLITWALRPLVRDQRQTLASGILLALATLLKLNVVFVVPFLALRRRFRVLGGYLLGAAVIALSSLVLDGPGLLSEYVRKELPRISLYGERGTPEMRLSEDDLRTLRSGVPESHAMRDGRLYRRELFGFVANASLARVVSPGREGAGGDRTTAGFALLIVLGAFLLLLTALRRHGHGAVWSPIQEFIYWQIVLVIILLSGPLTWAMNTVWLLPSGLVVLHAYPSIRRANQAAWLWACVVGLILAALPDHHTFSLLTPYAQGMLNFKYVAAEVLVFVSLLLGLKGSANGPA